MTERANPLRRLCRCGHVETSHRPPEGPSRPRSLFPCSTGDCPCGGWFPAYPVYADRLPDGVTAVLDLRSGLTVVECAHSEVVPREGRPGTVCAFCSGMPDTTSGYALPVKRLVFAPRELALL